MASKSPYFLLFTFLSLTLFFNPSAAARVIPGGDYKPINPNDPTILELAKFAVSDYDKEYKKDMTLEKVIKGEFKEGDGRTYWLTIKATSSKNVFDSGVYMTIVSDNPSKHLRERLAFQWMYK